MAARLFVVRKHFASLPSTNTTAKELAARGDLSPDALTVVTADEQTAGRGRLGRAWTSSRDDVKATFCFRVPLHCLAFAYQLSPLMALVACRVIERHARAGPLAAGAVGAGGAAVAPTIKWPNDIIVGGGRKAGGILCELESAGGGGGGGQEHWAALGLGLNVNSMPETLDVKRAAWPLSTLRAETGGRAWDVAAITDDLATELAGALQSFLADGFAPFCAEYEARSLLLGKVIRFEDGGKPVQGRVSRIGADGRLYIEGAEERGFLSGEVSGVELVDEGGGGARLIEAERSPC